MSAYGDHERKAISRLRSACLIAVGLCPIVHGFRAKAGCVKTPDLQMALEGRFEDRQVDASGYRLSLGVGVRCGSVARCEWVAISSAAWWASTSQGACPPGIS
jgi:hypothetical protein